MPTPNIRFVAVTSEPSRLSMNCRKFFRDGRSVFLFAFCVLFWFLNSVSAFVGVCFVVRFNIVMRDV
jgi:hypothetical protein